MSVLLNDAIQNNSPKPVDNKYGIFTSGAFRPYTNVAEANATIQAAYRSIGLSVLVTTGSGNAEYWYQAGIADGNLVPKTPTSSVASPLVITGGNITIQPANTSQGGYLTSTDWNTFNSKISGVQSANTSVGLFSIYGSTTSGTVSIKALQVNPGLSIVDNGTYLTLSTSATTATSVGTVTSLIAGSSGFNVNFRGLTVGTGLSISSNSTDLNLSLTATTIPAPVVTSNATPSALSSITIENNSAGMVQVTMIGVVVGSTSTYTIAQRYAKYYKTGGVLTVIEVGDTISESLGVLSTANWTLVGNGTSNNIDIQITGEASTSIKWTATIQKYFTT